MAKKRKIVFIIILLILGMAIAGIVYYLINQKDVAEDSTLEEEILISEEMLINDYGLSREDLEGIDINDFIESFVKPRLVRRGSISEEEVRSMLITYKKYAEYEVRQAEIEQNKKDDYAEMFSREYKGGYEDEYQSEITIIAVKVTDGGYRESVVFDLANQTYYFGELMDVTDDYSQATASGELSEEDVEVIRELVGEAEVSKWKADMGWVRPWDHDYSTYVMQIECSDGNSYGYTGIRKLPENFSDFYFGLKDVKDL